MRIIAHRGGSKGTPENSMSAFENSIRMNADSVEFDVRLSSDGVAVVMHDATLDRTTNGTGPLSGQTADELAQLSLGNGERIPKLVDVLELISGKIPAIIELKTLEAAPVVIEEIRKRPHLKWTGLSSAPGALEALRSAFPEADLAVGTVGSREAMEKMLTKMDVAGHKLSSEQADHFRKRIDTFNFDDIFDQAAELNATKVGVYWEAIDAEMVERIHSRGLHVGAWTVNNPEDADRLLRYGIDTLTTDDPALMLQVRDALRSGIHS